MRRSITACLLATLLATPAHAADLFERVKDGYADKTIERWLAAELSLRPKS